jgi:hypothetical protein
MCGIFLHTDNCLILQDFSPLPMSPCGNLPQGGGDFSSGVSNLNGLSLLPSGLEALGPLPRNPVFTMVYLRYYSDFKREKSLHIAQISRDVNSNMLILTYSLV